MTAPDEPAGDLGGEPVPVNLVRVVFGTQNLQFETPFYVRGGVQVLGDFIVTWNRLVAILMAVATLTLVWLLLRRTPLRAEPARRDAEPRHGRLHRHSDRDASISLAFGLARGWRASPAWSCRRSTASTH